MTRAFIWAAVSITAQTEEADKDSRPLQIAKGEALAAHMGWEMVTRLEMPGHSRRYLRFDELANDTRAQGIDAFDRLQDLIVHHSFDVLICRDADRFARTQALHAYIVESIIDAGRALYSLADGMITASNYRVFIDCRAIPA
ncbi:MAG TPA: recombinase family protein [Aggregatilineales bacterium]|nr:recombinase family protein [Aggregatilineales bacterium]